MVIITNSSPPEEGVLHHEPSCQMLVDEVSGGTGHLYVTESAVVWISDESQTSITLMYRQISLHAIQRVPIPLIFMMLDYKFRLPGQEEPPQPEADDDYEPDETPSTEIKFIPQNEASLTSIYESLNMGQTLHPDEEAQDDDGMMGDLDDDFMVSDVPETEDAANRMEELSIAPTNGHSAEDDEDQFADA